VPRLASCAGPAPGNSDQYSPAGARVYSVVGACCLPEGQQCVGRDVQCSVAGGGGEVGGGLHLGGGREVVDLDDPVHAVGGQRPDRLGRIGLVQHDVTAVPALTGMGYQNVMWGSDYPHLEGTYGHTQKTLHELFDGVDENVRRRITVGAFLDLFPHIGEPPDGEAEFF
jgi:hypothetical protein